MVRGSKPARPGPASTPRKMHRRGQEEPDGGEAHRATMSSGEIPQDDQNAPDLGRGSVARHAHRPRASPRAYSGADINLTTGRNRHLAEDERVLRRTGFNHTALRLTPPFRPAPDHFAYARLLKVRFPWRASGLKKDLRWTISVLAARHHSGRRCWPPVIGGRRVPGGAGSDRGNRPPCSV